MTVSRRAALGAISLRGHHAVLVIERFTERNVLTGDGISEHTLHGSEYWTYTLPRRVGVEQAARLTQACLPAGPASALRSGLIDRVIEGGTAAFRGHVADLARQLATSPGYPQRLAAKNREITAAQKTRPLDAYRAAELAAMHRNFFDPREPHAGLRRAFVYKHKPSRTPPHLRRHPAHPGPSRPPWSPGQQTIAALNRRSRA